MLCRRFLLVLLVNIFSSFVIVFFHMFLFVLCLVYLVLFWSFVQQQQHLQRLLLELTICNSQYATHIQIHENNILILYWKKKKYLNRCCASSFCLCCSFNMYVIVFRYALWVVFLKMFGNWVGVLWVARARKNPPSGNTVCNVVVFKEHCVKQRSEIVWSEIVFKRTSFEN